VKQGHSKNSRSSVRLHAHKFQSESDEYYTEAEVEVNDFSIPSTEDFEMASPSQFDVSGRVELEGGARGASIVSMAQVAHPLSPPLTFPVKTGTTTSVVMTNSGSIAPVMVGVTMAPKGVR
jgi:hypothetical protein